MDTRLQNSLVGCLYAIKPRSGNCLCIYESMEAICGLVQVLQVNSKLFIFQFRDEKGCDQFLTDGPFTFGNHPFLL